MTLEMRGNIWSNLTVYPVHTKHTSPQFCIFYSGINAQCTMHSTLCIVHSVQCPVHCAQCTVYSAQLTVHILQCRVWPVHSPASPVTPPMLLMPSSVSSRGHQLNLSMASASLPVFSYIQDSSFYHILLPLLHLQIITGRCSSSTLGSEAPQAITGRGVEAGAVVVTGRI